MRSSVFVSLLVSVCALGFFFSAPTAHAELIETYTVGLHLSETASVRVTEEIVYQFSEAKHGIFRCVPIVHQEKASVWYKERYIDISFKEVTMDSKPVAYTTDESHDEVCLTVGDSTKTVDGVHTYRIVYDVQGALSFPSFGGAELYWDAVGAVWDVPILQASARVSAPVGLLLRERACYQGAPDTSSSCFTEISETGEVHFVSSMLAPGEGMTIAQSVNRIKVPHDAPERVRAVLFFLLFIPLVSVVVGYSLYRYKTKHKTKGPTIVQYEPYPGVKPMYAGFLFDKRLDDRDIVAGVVRLAREGFLTIKKIDKKVLFIFDVDEYVLTLVRPLADATDAFQHALLVLFFGESALPQQTVSLTELKENYAERTKRTIAKKKLIQSLERDLVAEGYYTAFHFSSSKLKYASIMCTFASVVLIIFTEGLLIPLLILALVGYDVLSQGRRTRKGYEARDHLKGFKEFLSVTETHRYIFHNAPEKNAEQFMEYLPYAIAFNVEKKWAEVFEGVLVHNPSWYIDDARHGFNAVSLSQSLTGFASVLQQTHNVSSTGGSGGGGSVGGGSGGGGGGSW